MEKSKKEDTERYLVPVSMDPTKAKIELTSEELRSKEVEEVRQMVVRDIDLPKRETVEFVHSSKISTRMKIAGLAVDLSLFPKELDAVFDPIYKGKSFTNTELEDPVRTLAFGIPLIERLNSKGLFDDSNRTLRAIILESK